MKKGLLLALAILCCASLVFAQAPGSIAVYGSQWTDGSDPPTENCGVTEGPFVTFHFYHVADECATASEFIFDITGTNYMLFGFNTSFSVLGGINTGLSVTYGAGLTGPIYLGSASYGVNATTPPCTKLYVKGHPIPSVEGATVPLAFDCGALQTPPVAGQFLYLRGSYVIMNPDESCPCEGTVPAEETSWGQIKSLYN